MAYPHTFSFLRDPERPAIFLCGAGASYGLNPLPQEIMATKRDAAEAEITAITKKPFPDLGGATGADLLYIWAEKAEDELIAVGHRAPKLKIAQVLGITSDPRWLAGLTRSVATVLPRHRVLARLVRERCLQSIWTFNWDFHIEASLESIGLREQEHVADQPWPMRYQRICTLKDYGKSPHARTIAIHKRHGCVKSLRDFEDLELSGKATAADYAELRFLISRRELAEVQDKTTAEYHSFQGQIDSEFAGRPLAVCGWSASEKYLLDEFDKCADQIKSYPNGTDRLSIVDPVFNSNGHVRLAGIYGVSKDQCHFPIAPAPSVPDLDSLFLWIQSLYAINLIGRTLDDQQTLQKQVLALLAGLEVDPQPTWIAHWVDFLLPAWVQLCWRSGLVVASYRGKKLRPEDIRLEGEDWYVPLSQDISDRPELTAAAFLLCAIQSSGKSFRYDLVPGALHDVGTGRLLVPLPAWGDLSDANYLNALPRVIDRVQRVRGFTTKVTLLAMGNDGVPTAADRRERLKAAYIATARLPVDADVTVIGLDAL